MSRRFEFLHTFLSPVKARAYYARKTATWRKRNPHNTTTVSMDAPIDVITVGNYTYGELNVHWYGSPHERLEIGNYCSIAGNVHFILGGEHDYHKVSTYPVSEKIFGERTDGICKGPVVIDDDVWIGFGAIILSGVHIGQGSVIAAGSIVTKDVPPYAIWIGNGVKKYRFSKEIINRLCSVDYSKVSPEAYKKCCDIDVSETNIDAVISALYE